VATGKKTGGRKKGTPNKKTVEREEAVKAIKESGVDPKDYIVSCIKNPDNFDEVKYRASVDLMPYMYAKLASTSVKGSLAVANINEMSEEQLMELANSLGLPIDIS